MYTNVSTDTGSRIPLARQLLLTATLEWLESSSMLPGRRPCCRKPNARQGSKLAACRAVGTSSGAPSLAESHPASDDQPSLAEVYHPAPWQGIRQGF
jgi:hypothetical protein